MLLMPCFLRACTNASGAPGCRSTFGGAFAGGQPPRTPGGHCDRTASRQDLHVQKPLQVHLQVQHQRCCCHCCRAQALTGHLRGHLPDISATRLAAAAGPPASLQLQVQQRLQGLEAWWQGAQKDLVGKQAGATPGACLKCLQTMTTCTYTSTEPASSKWLLQVQQKAPGMLPRREGSDRQATREGPACSKCMQTIDTCTYSSTEAAGSKWLQGLQPRNACRFKMVQQRLQRLRIQAPVHIQVHLEEHQQGHRHVYVPTQLQVHVHVHINIYMYIH